MGVPHSLTQTNISNGQIPAGKFQPHCLHARPIILTFPIGCDLHYRSDLSRLVNAAQCSRIIGSGISILSATPTPHCPERIPPPPLHRRRRRSLTAYRAGGGLITPFCLVRGSSRTTPLTHNTCSRHQPTGVSDWETPAEVDNRTTDGTEAANRRDGEGRSSYKIRERARYISAEASDFGGKLATIACIEASLPKILTRRYKIIPKQ